MLRGLLHKIKHALVTLRFSILFIFVTLFVTAMLLLITINYSYSSKIIFNIANKLMNQVASSMYTEFSRELAEIERDDTLSAQFFEHGILDSNNFEQIIDYTYTLANRFYLVQAAYWVDEKGNFIITKYEPDDSLTSIIYNAKKNPGIKEFIYRDVKGNVIKHGKEALVWDPRVRPWYLAAKNSKKTVWTDIYLFSPTPFLGITVATPIYKNGEFHGVFGLDVRLDWLSWYVGEQKLTENGITFIVSTTGKIIAFPGYDKFRDQTKLYDIHENTEKAWIAKSFDVYKSKPTNQFDFNYNNQNYLAVYTPIPTVAKQDWLIGVVAPSNDFEGDMKKGNWINVALSLLILLVAILLVSALVTRITRPIKKLVKQTEKIKNFELEEEIRIHTRIREIKYLSNALHAMKLGLKSFQKYVPAGLVRLLIETDQDARIGGSKRPLVVLFSDIKDFTIIAENMAPDSLMVLMCQYFDALSTIINKEQGTIDKYIGDSIMAFWGAPVAVENPSYHAATAALKSLKKLNELNTIWLRQGKIILTTRFGIHLGDAVVGNLGSSERLNYTAIGDTINFASRLEGVNKIYGTQILVSEDVAAEIQNDFILRLVDYIMVKGKSNNKYIYELLGKTNQELAFNVNEYKQVFQQAFTAYQNRQWDHAIQLFKQCVIIYPNDSLAPVFIQRCENFKTQPPEEWDGAWKLSEK